MLTKLDLLYTPNYGASNGIRTRIVSMANWKTNHCPIPAYRCKKIMQPSYGHHPRVSGLLLTNISSLCSKNIGAGNRNRTCNLLITSQLRCQLRHAGRERKRVRWAVSISRILDGVTQPWIRTTNRSARATELVLRVFHWWGRYCLHLTFNACLRTHGPV